MGQCQHCGQLYLSQQWKGRGESWVPVISASPPLAGLSSAPGFNPSNHVTPQAIS